MKKIAVSIFIILCLFTFYSFSLTLAAPFRQDKLSIQTDNESIDFSIEIAETWQQQELGFMHRAHIPNDHGMLFIWDKDSPISMWMKNTPLSLDMLFVDAKGKIIYIAENAVPNSTDIITAPQPVRAVVELVGGACAAKHIRVGDHVIHSYFSP